jgi:hypothetical protein
MSLYSSVQPLSQRTNGKYLPNDSVDFVMDFAGREVDPSTIRISGELYITTDAQGDVLLNGTQQIFIDPKVGAHGIFQQYITSLPDAGIVVENFANVPRWIAMKEAATQTKTGTGSILSHVIELKAPNQEQMRSVLGVGGDKLLVSFSIKPYCALTHAMNNISYSKTGTVKLTCLMASATQLLFGAGCDANTSYYLKNLQLDYLSSPDTQQPLTMMKVSSLKQTLSSSNQQLSVIMPISSSSLSMSFVRLAEENTLTNNYTQLAVVPAVTRVEFSYNDIVSSVFITYALENKPEITVNALLSLDSTGKYDLLQDILDVEKGLTENYLIGTLFGDVALANNTKVGVNIQSAVQGGDAFAAYLYFTGMMQF